MIRVYVIIFIPNEALVLNKPFSSNSGSFSSCEVNVKPITSNIIRQLYVSALRCADLRSTVLPSPTTSASTPPFDLSVPMYSLAASGKTIFSLCKSYRRFVRDALQGTRSQYLNSKSDFKLSPTTNYHAARCYLYRHCSRLISSN
jgi:hypothetical protein